MLLRSGGGVLPPGELGRTRLGDYVEPRSADNLRVHRDPETSTTVLEYEVHGTSVPTGLPYDNRFVGVVRLSESLGV
ncbi:hypothetical protein [Streptomyces sp. NPDC059460]|uniref:hypothetical protein n=1 Tax=Streptomyces sp. NPDC059460 TaxID=3346840 RepID=UPI0036CEE9AB